MSNASPPPAPIPTGSPDSPSGPVIAVAIVNFVLGGLHLFCGGVVLLVGGAIVGLGATAAQQAAEPDAAAAAGIIGGLAVLIAIVIMITGVPMIVAGVGLLRARRWARILTLILGAIAGLVALTELGTHNTVPLVVHAGYCTLVFVVLLNRRYAPEFYQGR